MNHNNAKQGGTGSSIKRLVTGLCLLSGALVLSACGGGASNTQNPNTTGNTLSPSASNAPPPYYGPAAADQDTLYFYKYLWNNLRTQNHCASCHDVGGQGKAYFADNSDVNAAYSVVTNSNKPLVDLSNPAASLMVTKFSTGSGHFCLDGSNAVCAQELTNWITAWANAKNGGSSSTTITLTPPTIQAPKAPLNFPSSPTNYDAVYNLVRQHCSGCHVPNPTLNATPVSPEFATDSITDSYALASSIPLINLSDPTKSRFYTRLADDGHNCWTDCTNAASQMLIAIKQFTDPIQQAAASAPSATSIYLASDAVNLFNDGIVASGGGRYEADQIALYNFKVGSGNTILDVSGVAPTMNLTLSGTEGVDYTWMSNWGIQFNTKNAKAQALTSDSAKLQQLIATNNAGYSIEAWVAPANTTQTDSDIVTYTGGASAGNNFSLGQNADSYEAFNRDQNDMTGNANPLDSTGLNASLQHVVLTNDPVKGTQVYINGVPQLPDPANPSPDPSSIGENLQNWDPSFALVLGNNPERMRSWLGQIRLLAIHNAPLTQAEITQNYDAGVGQKYLLLFNISRYLGAECNPDTGPSCFILLQASVFDNYSYLFSNPRFINLNDPNVSTEPPLFLKGMRIGINGSDSANDQLFSSMDVCINGPCAQSDSRTVSINYAKGITPDEGAALSSQGAVIAMQNGPKGNGGLAPDMIFLTFQQINDQLPNTPYVVTSRLTPAIPAVNPVAIDNVLIHTFEEINATLSALTGVPRTTSNINDDSNSIVDGSGVTDGAYTTAKQALPSTHDAGTFNAANQMAITQLAIAYCNDLVNDPTAANQMFGLTFDSNLTLNFSDTNTQDQIINPLLEKLMNVEYTGSTPTTELSNMPSESSVHTDLANLMTTLASLPPKGASSSACTPTCTNARTLQIIKATCATAVASAPMVLH